MNYLRPLESFAEDPAERSDDHREQTNRTRRRSAWRDGSINQTVIEGLESGQAFRRFERTIVASFDPRSAIERELIHRLASLLWRLRRASGIEAGLLRLRDDFDQDDPRPLPRRLNQMVIGQVAPGGSHSEVTEPSTVRAPAAGRRQARSKRPGPEVIAQRFLRLVDRDPTALNRVGAHEARLWHHAAQTMCLLETLRQNLPSVSRRRSFCMPVPRRIFSD